MCHLSYGHAFSYTIVNTLYFTGIYFDFILFSFMNESVIEYDNIL